ncbi:ABC transporter permease [Parapedobacter koreensis]|uniref:Putative ABC transport system permease protein n=1 Tax=Parapedobacter koreensis TaxID=332977 RepID=A0A1H7QYS6_9SPHI|nr:ABC transporter permease [Parapedobacter koreensis]SEL53146.1 putative ABC transport system permease protein [Parapedobacter koreensis]
MITHTFKIAIRHLWRNKTFSLINLSGLVVGLVSSFCIATYLYHESTYDSVHPDGANTFRMVSSNEWIGENDKTLSASTFLPVTQFIESNIPEITEIARVKPVGTAVLRMGTEVFTKSAFMWADASLLQLLDIQFLQGDPNQALSAPNAVIITQKEANRLFNTEDPMGQVITINDQDLTVTGVIANMPSNTHLKKDLIGSLNTFKNLDNPWSHQGYIYLRLAAQTDPAQVTKKINAAMAGNVSWLSEPPTYQLQPIRDIHLHSTHIQASPEAVDIKYLYIFGIIGAILVFSTSFNYISLSISDYAARVKDFGMKKILGSDKRQLIFQPLMECLLLCSVAAFSAVLITLSALPVINGLLGSSIDREFLLSLPNLAVLLIVLLLLLTVSAIYPVVLVIRSRPIATLSKAPVVSHVGFPIRKPLMVFQFAIAIALVLSVIVIQQQMDYLSSERLGFTKEQVLVLRTPRFNKLNAPLMKQRLLQLAGVTHASVSTGTPFGGGFINGSKEEKDGVSYSLSEFIADPDFVQTLDMELLAGRNLLPTDSNRVVVNEALVRTMGWDEPIGQRTGQGLGGDKEVVGVVRDFQLNNIRTAIHPTIISLGDEYVYTIIVRLQTKNLAQNLASIGAVWKETAPEHPLEYEFLDEQFEELFKSETQFQQLSKVFSFIAILIACLGLYGAIVHAAQQRVKEIGIRKVLGASVSGIAALLSKDFVRLVLIAIVIASPIAWWAMNTWLEDFAYRIAIEWWMFAAAGLAAMVIALATVSWQAIRAAVANPVESLRDE